MNEEFRKGPKKKVSFVGALIIESESNEVVLVEMWIGNIIHNQAVMFLYFVNLFFFVDMRSRHQKL